MRKKTENMDIIVDKKTVRVTTAVFVTVMTMLAAIAAMFFKGYMHHIWKNRCKSSGRVVKILKKGRRTHVQYARELVAREKRQDFQRRF